MSAPQKGSRLIVIEGQCYRWRVRQKPTYHQALGWSPLTFSVERADKPGAVLLVEMPGVRPDSLVGAPISGPALPGAVARFVRVALAAGWKPAQPGGPFLLRR